MELADKVLQGDIASVARLLRDIEDEMPDASKELEALYPHTGKAYLVGLSGPPGVGKSSLIASLISALKKKNMTIGVVAVDPTSPFTGGAILGDRIRMQKHSLDKDVFIRSMATRGWAGGLAKTTLSLVYVLDAMGKDIILVETVGAGQSEVDIQRAADTVLILLSPGGGDEMQMMKAGIMEIADIFVVNKADKEGALNVAAEIESMLAFKTYPPGEWEPPVVMTEATSDKGTDELVEKIFKHREFLTSTGRLEKRRRERARLDLVERLEGFVRNYVSQETRGGSYLEKLVDDLAQRKTDPQSAALKIINRFTEQFKSAKV